MKPRTDLLLSLLLLCLLLGATTKAAVCEVSCAVARYPTCHSSSATQGRAGMGVGGVDHTHCTGAARVTGAAGVTETTGSGDPTLKMCDRLAGLVRHCAHWSPDAIVDADSQRASFTSLHGVRVGEVLWYEPPMTPGHFTASLKPPPLQSSVASLLVGLRI